MYNYSMLLWFLLLNNCVSSLNILGIYSHHGRSHFKINRVLLKELANKGHNVTVISHFPEENPKENYHDIDLSGSINSIEGTVSLTDFNYGTVLWAGYQLATVGVKNCKEMLENKHLQEVIKQKLKFDVILVELFNSDCALGVAHKIGGPVVGMTCNVPLSHHDDKFGIPSNPSYVSYRYLGRGTHPTLLQRLEILFFKAYFKTIFWISQKIDDFTLSKYFDDIPPLDELGRKIKYLLAYQSFPLTGSRLLPANVREVGGYHVIPPQPLNGDLQKFVNEADHGVIYISLGTLTDTLTFGRDKLEAILKVMEELPQRFIVKWDKSIISNKHDKVYVDSWLPQIDILGHPKTVAFLSHCGMGSTIEAVHFGVPTVAMPFFGDQPLNAAAIEESGFGTQIQYNDLTRDNLMVAFKKILDPKFRDRAKEISAAWKDRPNTALEEAVFWIEFVARHPTLSFRTRAADVPFYQYLFIDIIGLFVGIIFIIYMFVKFYDKIIENVRKVKVRTKNKTKRK